MTQSIGRIHETNFNPELARALRRMRVAWQSDNAILYERTGVFENDEGKRGDIIVSTPGAAPVAIELEYDAPAEKDAIARLGKRLKHGGIIRSAIAVGVPPDVRHWTDSRLQSDIPSLEFSIVVFSSVATTPLHLQGDLLPKQWEIIRWPASGVLKGTLNDLACLCEYAPAPAPLVYAISHYVAGRIRSVADTLHRTGTTGGVADDMAELLGQYSQQQAIRLACCIWLTALRLHNALSQQSDQMQKAKLRPVVDLRMETANDMLTADAVRREWNKILSINYRAIFQTAQRALDTRIATASMTETLTSLADLLATHVEPSGLGNRIDFAGELFPKLLDDREETASHYTLPQTAELLAALAVPRLRLPDWSDASAVAQLRIADMSCGTGSLLRAAYQNVRQRHEAAGGNAGGVHRAMMSGQITGLDVNALATHMTAAGLSASDITEEYDGANIGVATLFDGKTGSLELLDSESIGSVVVNDESQDLVIQNPPYNRARGGRKVLAVAGISEADRMNSQYRLETLRRQHGAGWTNGQAGHGADFGALAHRKLKPGGVFASVLPLTAAHAESWAGYRRQIEQHYEDITAVAFTIDTTSVTATMMSEDTHINEMLLVATKRSSPVTPSPPRPASPPHRLTSQSPRPEASSAHVACVNISRPVGSLAEAYWYAKLITGGGATGRSGRLYEAGEEWGSWVRLPAVNGEPWRALGIRDADLAVAGLELLNGQFYIRKEARSWSLSIPFTTLGSIVSIGPTHHLIGHPDGGDAIGIFTFYPITSYDSGEPAYPALWAAHAKTQQCIGVAPTHKGEPLPSKTDSDIKPMLDKRSDLFISKNLRMTSQSLAAARTNRPTMGGNAWAALLSPEADVKSALSIWLNSTLCAIVRTCYAQTQQPGRALMKINALPSFPVPDFAADSDDGRHARQVAQDNIDALSTLRLKPLSYAFEDENRKEIDRVALDMLGLGGDVAVEDGLDWLRRAWCREPSTHGGNARIMQAVG